MTNSRSLDLRWQLGAIPITLTMLFRDPDQPARTTPKHCPLGGNGQRRLGPEWRPKLDVRASARSAANS